MVGTLRTDSTHLRWAVQVALMPHGQGSVPAWARGLGDKRSLSEKSSPERAAVSCSEPQPDAQPMWTEAERQTLGVASPKGVAHGGPSALAFTGAGGGVRTDTVFAAPQRGFHGVHLSLSAVRGRQRSSPWPRCQVHPSVCSGAGLPGRCPVTLLWPRASASA